MKIKLTPEESEKYFYNAVCNLSGYLSGYGLELSVADADYAEAKKSLLDRYKKVVAGEHEKPCYEDVLMEVLKIGKPLTMIDHEGEGAYTQDIFLKDVHERVQNTPARHLLDMIEEELSDFDFFTASKPIDSEEELERQVEL